MNLLLMTKGAIVSIAVACAVVVVAIVVILLVLLKNKNAKPKEILPQPLEDRVLLSEIARSFEALIVLARKDEKLVAELKSLQDTINYLVATEKAEVLAIDNKIKQSVMQLRQTLEAQDITEMEHIQKKLLEIKLQISDRNTIL